MIEVGTWTSTNRLTINQLSVQQIVVIRKHLQVVTREVIKKKMNLYVVNFVLFQGKTLCCTQSA